MKIWIIGATAITLLLVAACGGGDDVEPATATAEPTATAEAEPTATEIPVPSPPDELTAAESEYLDAVAELIAAIGDKIGAQGEALSRLWNTRGVFLDQFEKYDVRSVISESGEKAEALDPPERFEAEHAELLAWFAFAEDQAPAYFAAVEAEEFVGIFANTAELEAGFNAVLVSADPVFCSAVVVERLELCADPDGGFDDYVLGMRAAKRHFEAQANPRISSFPPAMTLDETVAALQALQPAILVAFEDHIAAIELLEPPEDARADHERYVEYLTDRFALSREITTAADENRGDDLRNSLFPRDELLACAAEADISSNFLELIGATLPCG